MGRNFTPNSLTRTESLFAITKLIKRGDTSKIEVKCGGNEDDTGEKVTEVA